MGDVWPLKTIMCVFNGHLSLWCNGEMDDIVRDDDDLLINK